jgi:BirA family biotin operon repressor/biotin-[acetyl-CoA-carboxylase] ligase
MAAFATERFQRLLQTRCLGRTCHYAPVLASTNSSLRVMGRQGSPEGTIVLADEQTTGRGQAGKAWLSPPERNLLVSILLRPSIAPAQAPLMSLLAAVAVVDTLQRQGVACGIKWPNDVLIRGRKVAGILTELELHDDAVQFVVLGIGLNVNMTQVDLVRHLGAVAPTATSLQVVLAREVDREALLAALLASLEQWYETFDTGGAEAICAAWEARSLMRQRRLRAKTAETTWQGVAEGITRLGHLRLRRDDGELVVLTSAEVRFSDEPAASEVTAEKTSE